MFTNTIARPLLLAALVCCAHSHESKCNSDLQPKITARTPSKKSEPNSITDIDLYCHYGETITLSCTGNGTENLKIKSGNYLPTIQFNSTVRLVIQPYVGDYRYSCIDTKTNCEDALVIRVLPLMRITSPRLHYSLNEYGEREYFVSRGDPYEITCSGKELLYLTNTYYSTVKTESVNKTTVIHKAQASHIGKYNFYCSTEGRQSNILQLKIGFHPEGQHFQCLCHQWSKLECWWISSSKDNTFKLFYQKGSDKIPCDISGTNAVCASNDSNIFKRPLTVSLQSCNQVFCDNQSFVINSNLIRKPYPPSDFKVLDAKRNAVLAWKRPISDDEYLNCDYKVEYRQQAMEWRQVNSSSIQCVESYCELKLFVSCPNSLYEARVYVRLKEAPLEDKYLSEPATLHFFTDPNTVREPADQAISELNLCQVGYLKLHTITAITAINKIRNTWREKLDKIKKHIEYFKAIEEAEKLFLRS